DHLRGQRAGEPQRRNVGAQVRAWSALLFIVTGKGIAQLQDGGRIEAYIVGYESVTPVRCVQRIVRVPSGGWEDIRRGKNQFVIREPGKDALLRARVPIHSNVKPVGFEWVQT